MLCKTDNAVKAICLSGIKRNANTPNGWKFTRIVENNRLPEEFNDSTDLFETELPILEVFIAADSNCLLTTRRLIGLFKGNRINIQLIEIANCDFGFFKSLTHQSTERLKLEMRDGENVFLEYETGNAAIAVMHAIQFLRKDHFGLDE